MIQIEIGGLILLVLDIILLIWLSRLAGRIDGLTSEPKRGPGVVTRLREVATGGPGSKLHLPTDFEKVAKASDDRNDA
jgi:hypothetical protein